MDSGLLGKLGEQAPYLVIILLLVYLFLNYIGKLDDKRMAFDKDMEKTRTENAKERERERREHELTLANMQAQNMKQLIDNISQTMKNVADALAEHERASQIRYEKMGITDDLLSAAKEAMKKR